MNVKANGIELNYEVEGNGPWLTMSHSLACNISMWDPQMPVLTKKFKVLRFDTRGHGQSSAPAGEYTLDQLADDVKGLLDALNIKQTHWAGLSMGGMIGQAFALKYPGVFLSMVLADTTSRRPPDAAKMWGERVQSAQTKGMDSLVDSTLARWFTEPYRNSHKDVMAKIGDDIRKTPGGRLRRLLPRDLESGLPRPAEGNQGSGFGHGGRARPRHAAGSGSRDPAEPAGIGAEDHPVRGPSLEHRAGGRVQPEHDELLRPRRALNC